MNIDLITSELRNAAQILALHNAKQKNYALECVSQSILKNKEKILSANEKDVISARKNGMSEALVERLALDEKKFKSILDGIKTVIQQKDPVGEEISGWKTQTGLQIHQVRVPLGIVSIIYESRPNVTVDAFTLAYKSGNSILLRGSSNALESNKALYSAIIEGLELAGEDGVKDSIYLCTEGSHSEVNEILAATGKIDVVLPRGSAKLINLVVENAKVPVIQTGAGVCHLYVDEDADLDMAAKIAFNAKTQRPGACNAIECIVLNKKIQKEFLSLLDKTFNSSDKKVKFYLDDDAYKAMCLEFSEDELKSKNFFLAQESDFGFEFLDLTCAIKTVNSISQAVDFINSHNTKHSESIITNNRNNARIFQSQIDAACVYVNASTRFTDGGEFGFGAELGISTQKLHARGPMGASALTTTKFLIDGDGQIR